MGFGVGDLTDSDTGQQIQFGGQIADLVQLVAHLRVGEKNALQVLPRIVPLPDVVPCHEDRGCRKILDLNEQFERSRKNLLADTPTTILSRSEEPIA